MKYACIWILWLYCFRILPMNLLVLQRRFCISYSTSANMVYVTSTLKFKDISSFYGTRFISFLVLRKSKRHTCGFCKSSSDWVCFIGPCLFSGAGSNVVTPILLPTQILLPDLIPKSPIRSDCHWPTSPCYRFVSRQSTSSVFTIGIRKIGVFDVCMEHRCEMQAFICIGNGPRESKYFHAQPWCVDSPCTTVESERIGYW